MGKAQRILTTGLWALLVVTMLGIVATRATRSIQASRSIDGDTGATAAASAAAKLSESRTVEHVKFEPLFDAPAFELTDQNGNKIKSEDLRGKVYVADFIFTHCAGPCPVMTGKLADVQKLLGDADVKLVSFTVDPQRDTPAVLKEYSDRFDADPARWHFLTGTPEELHEVAIGFNIAARREIDESVTHSTQFLLVNQDGQVCGIYRNSDDDVTKALAADSAELAKKPRTPAK